MDQGMVRADRFGPGVCCKRQANMTSALLQEARRPSCRSTGTEITVVRDRINLAAFVPQWEDLATHALEPNPLYEHWMLLPALEGLAPGEGIRCVLVWIDGREGQRTLGGLFPLQPPAWYKGLPVGVLKSFRHAHWPICTPLVRAGTARLCLHALLDWFSRDGEGASLLELTNFPREGELYRVMAQVLHEREQMAVATDRSMCPRLRKEGSGADPHSLPDSALTYRVLRRGEDAQPWISDFLALDGGAGQRFTSRIMSEAHRRGRLLMAGIDVGGRPASRAAAITAGEGAFALRTAADQRFADYAARLAAEVENAKQFQALPALHWMDSLAHADNAFLCRLWGGARLLQTLLISNGAWGELATSAMPLLHWRRSMP